MTRMPKKKLVFLASPSSRTSRRRSQRPCLISLAIVVLLAGVVMPCHRVAGCETGPHSLGALAVGPPGFGVGPVSRQLRRRASSFVFLNPLLQDTSYREPSGTLFAAAPAPGRVAAPQAWCCGSRGLAATLRRDQDRSSAATEPYSCIKVLFSPLLRRRGA